MILVLVELENGSANEVSLETLALARSLGSDRTEAVVIGDVTDRDALTAELGAHGVDAVHQAVGEAFESFAGAAWAAALQQAQASTGATVVTAAGTPRGGEVLAHLAARLDVPMAANAIGAAGSEPVVVTRQVVGGAALEEMALDRAPAVFTVAGHAWAATPADEPTNPTWHEFTPEIAERDLVARVTATGQKEVDQSDSLKSARVVVGAGRGAGSAAGFGPVSELAEQLGGSLGVSRVVTSLGWRPHHEQVGQTGSRISPEVYIPCGISGAIQHWAGCASSKVILAVNTDAEAPMMTKANYAVVGDMHEVVPAIIAELKRRGSIPTSGG
ncbi:electron transfer flavoprotein subunit alpha/FixB family protein [Aeromicrobium sp.]|uniref:electron transfer flavoprotein subunit alpha/FixB family protein n=1 Tax=Aeromicrobium sp. TaxID=1871063 RepID=UPI003D6A9BE2